ncbi:MAG: hypothetical protein CMO81_01365 [Waddliaceae bacterium]|nr:hypothetical protein [Waddliaceae bacterium]
MDASVAGSAIFRVDSFSDRIQEVARQTTEKTKTFFCKTHHLIERTGSAAVSVLSSAKGASKVPELCAFTATLLLSSSKTVFEGVVSTVGMLRLGEHLAYWIKGDFVQDHRKGRPYMVVANAFELVGDVSFVLSSIIDMGILKLGEVASKVGGGAFVEGGLRNFACAAAFMGSCWYIVDGILDIRNGGDVMGNLLFMSRKTTEAALIVLAGILSPTPLLTVGAVAAAIGIGECLWDWYSKEYPSQKTVNDKADTVPVLVKA